MFGYAGNICRIDLSSGEVRKEPLNTEYVKDFIGGYGMNARLAYDFMKPGVDPLSPENTIIMGTGPFTGTMVPGSPRWFLTTKFPIPKFVASAAAECEFGILLKRAGLDHVIITGKAEKPVYLKIGEEVEVCDASHLWGKDIFETTDELRAAHNPCSVIAMGNAGEKLVKISLALVDKLSSVGRGGLGAIMGSKNLKAMVAVGGTKGVKVADPERFTRVVKPLVQRMREDPQRPRWAGAGMGRGWSSYVGRGMVYKNSTTLYSSEKAAKLFDIDDFIKHYRKRIVPTPACPYPCKMIMEVKEGDCTLTTQGTNILQPLICSAVRNDISNMYEILKVWDFQERQGLEGYSTADIISFAVHLYELGIITKEDTDGLELKDGFETTMALARKIAFREGFGDVLADGILEAAKKIGRGAEQYAEPVQLKGGGYLIDARNFFNPEAFGQVVDPRGNQAPAESITMLLGVQPDQVKRYNRRIGVPEEVNGRLFAQGFYNVAIEAKYVEDWWSLISSLPSCLMMTIVRFIPLATATEIYCALTGMERAPEEMIRAGERARNMERAVNYREGYTRKDDKFPEAWFQPLKVEGGEEIRLMDYHKTRYLTREDCYKMLEDYYRERGWDVEQGVPTKEKFASLGLGDIAEELSLP